jgi:hypothetical protein
VNATTKSFYCIFSGFNFIAVACWTKKGKIERNKREEKVGKNQEKLFLLFELIFFHFFSPSFSIIKKVHGSNGAWKVLRHFVSPPFHQTTKIFLSAEQEDGSKQETLTKGEGSVRLTSFLR